MSSISGADLAHYPNFMRLSQRHLKVLETCPRQFQYVYCDRLTLPISPKLQAKTQLGSDFHLLMHQRELGLPIEPILARVPQLAGWMQAIDITAPELFQPQPQTWRESEHIRSLTIGSYQFTAIYDLAIFQPDRADIIDWKTYPLPRYKKDLDRDWQTRLYLYLLAETSDYAPKQLAFTYWFIQSTPQPKSVRIGYSLTQHQQTQTDLAILLERLTDWLAPDRREPLPQVAASTGICQSCNFVARCGRDRPDSLAQSDDLQPLTLTDVPLVPI